MKNSKKFQKYMFSINKVFPPKVFPKGIFPLDEDEQVSYDFFPGDYIEHLDNCKRYFRNNHPLPSL